MVERGKSYECSEFSFIINLESTIGEFLLFADLRHLAEKIKLQSRLSGRAD